MTRPRRSPTPTLLDAEHAAFVQGGVTINVAATTPDNLPTLVRAIGCRVSRDRRRMTVLLAASRSGPVLDAIRANGRVAAVFTLPSTHRSAQWKGTDAVVAERAPGDRRLIERYTAALAVDFKRIGFAPAFAAALVRCQPDDIVAVEFSPSAAFSQTPGPNAGEPLVRPA